MKSLKNVQKSAVKAKLNHYTDHIGASLLEPPITPDGHVPLAPCAHPLHAPSARKLLCKIIPRENVCVIMG